MPRKKLPDAPLSLSRRERQIMDVVFRLGTATAAEIHEQLQDAPTYTTIRGLLRVLERKGHLRHEEKDGRFVYTPMAAKRETGASVLAHVVRTFFDGSPERAIAALLGSTGPLSRADLDRLSAILDEAERRRDPS